MGQATREVLHRPFEPARETGKLPLPNQLGGKLVNQALMARCCLLADMSSNRQAAHTQSTVSVTQDTKDAWNPNILVPPTTPEGTMSLELFHAACNSMVSRRLPPVRCQSQAKITDNAVTPSTNTQKDCW